MVAVTLVITVLSGVLNNTFPFHEIMKTGMRLKQRINTDEKNSYLQIATKAREPGDILIFDFKKGRHFWYPQIVIWLEDSTGRYLETLFVTNSTANGLFYSGRTRDNFKDFGSDNKNEDVVDGELRTVDALPYWSHKYEETFSVTLQAGTSGHLVPDAISGATPEGSFYLRTSAGVLQKRFQVLVELNVAFDENEYYSEYDFPDDTLYHGGAGLLGQPSLVYKAMIDTSSPQRFYLMKLAGHSHHSGLTGELYTDLSGITTAVEIIDRIVIEVVKNE